MAGQRGVKTFLTPRARKARKTWYLCHVLVFGVEFMNQRHPRYPPSLGHFQTVLKICWLLTRATQKVAMESEGPFKLTLAQL